MAILQRKDIKELGIVIATSWAPAFQTISLYRFNSRFYLVISMDNHFQLIYQLNISQECSSNSGVSLCIGIRRKLHLIFAVWLIRYHHLPPLRRQLISDLSATIKSKGSVYNGTYSLMVSSGNRYWPMTSLNEGTEPGG